MSLDNLHPQIRRNIEQSAKDGGVLLKELAVGDSVLIETQNSIYNLRKTGEDAFQIDGNAKYCPTPIACRVHGSTWGGSMIKVGFIGRGMCLEFSTKDYPRIITTVIKDLIVNRKDNGNDNQ